MFQVFCQVFFSSRFQIFLNFQYFITVILIYIFFLSDFLYFFCIFLHFFRIFSWIFQFSLFSIFLHFSWSSFYSFFLFPYSVFQFLVMCFFFVKICSEVFCHKVELKRIKSLVILEVLDYYCTYPYPEAARNSFGSHRWTRKEHFIKWTWACKNISSKDLFSTYSRTPQ